MFEIGKKRFIKTRTLPGDWIGTLLHVSESDQSDGFTANDNESWKYLTLPTKHEWLKLFKWWYFADRSARLFNG